MNLTKRFLSVLMVAVMLFAMVPVARLADVSLFSFEVSAESDGDFEYEINDGEAIITGYMGEGGDVVIPNTLGGCPVVCVGYGAFSECETIETVDIPESVTEIQSYAFRGCISLESIVVGSQITSIGHSAFLGCETLGAITVDENNLYYSSDEYGVLFNKDKTILIQYPLGNDQTEYKAPDSLTRIEAYAFNYALNLVSVALPDDINFMGEYAFGSCQNLKSIEIPEGITEIPFALFYGCTALESIIIPKNVTCIYPSLYNCNNITEVYYDGTKAQWNSIAMLGELYDMPIFRAATIHCTDGDIVSDKITDGDLIPSEPTTETPPITAEPIAPTDPVGTPTIKPITTEKEETTTKPTTTKKEETTKAPDTTTPSTTKAPTTTEKKEEPVVNAKKPAKVKVKKPTSKKKKQVVVTWNKVKNANGYQVAYSTSKKFTKKTTKTKLIKKAKTTKTTLKKLKSGKKYFIKVRAYKTVNNKKIYGAYCKVMNVKVK